MLYKINNAVSKPSLIQTYVQMSEFITLKAPETINKPWNPKLDFKLQVGSFDRKHNNANTTKDNQQIHKIWLTASIDTSLDNEKIFSAKLQQSGLFAMEDTVDESQLDFILHTICTQILYPYLTTRLSDMVIQAGFPPVYMEPMNFAEQYRSEHNTY